MPEHASGAVSAVVALSALWFCLAVFW